jgi:1-acyl-sn-glycerol-3-phosphate acyltransferase
MTGALIACLVRFICGAYPRWVGCLPSSRPRIYFANHTSHLDAAVVWAALPREARARTRPVAAKDYWTRGPLRIFLAARVFRAVLIDRRKVTAENNPIERMLEGLAGSGSLILFPEGGRSTGFQPAPFKSGIYHLARRRPDVELVPVLIDNLNRVLPKGEVLPVPFLCSVTFGAPIRLESAETKPGFLERARQSVCHLRPA